MYDVIILGGGPAGLTAGLYSARGGLNSLVVENAFLGGQASTTPEVVNYPGVKSADGYSLTATMAEQAKNFGCEIITAPVSRVALDGKIKSIVADGKEYSAKAIIIASGAYEKKLGIEREDELVGKGVSYCATCDGGFFKNKPVAVVGGGNTAVEDALYLERFASKVYLIHRRDSLRANKVLSDKIERSTVDIVWNSVVDELVGTPLSALKIKDVNSNEIRTLDVCGLFVAIGRTPASKDFDSLEIDENGYIVTDENMRTNVDGVFAAGDVRSKPLRQIITACSDGAIAADSALKYLS